MKKILKYIIFWISIIVLLITSSCQAEVVSHTSQKLERYAVSTNDLPDGWAFFSEDWSGELGEDYYAATYGIPNKDIIGLSQVIAMYPSEEQTQLGYSEREEKWFSVGEVWPGTEFTPLNSNDKYRYECVQIFSDIVDCTFLQGHNNIVVLILVSIDGKTMTMAQFNEILRVLDERLNIVALE
ncbi:MAG TPA: hypothetical protein PKE48_11760 [Anaerolineales bacterium]|nr:hypothetical protein [Anaerolineales bacterium]